MKKIRKKTQKLILKKGFGENFRFVKYFVFLVKLWNSVRFFFISLTHYPIFMSYFFCLHLASLSTISPSSTSMPKVP